MTYRRLIGLCPIGKAELPPWQATVFPGSGDGTELVSLIEIRAELLLAALEPSITPHKRGLYSFRSATPLYNYFGLPLMI
jgi:hypothetical protein